MTLEVHGNPPSLLWRSRSGRLELHTEGERVRVKGFGLDDDRITCTDLLDITDVLILLRALAPSHAHAIALGAADAVILGEPYGLFEPVNPLVRQDRCEDCRKTVRNPRPWWDINLNQVRWLGPGCWHKRRIKQHRAIEAGDQLTFDPGSAW